MTTHKKEIVLDHDPLFPFGKAFWINREYRNIRQALYKFLNRGYRLHIYGHHIYNTCAICTSKENIKPCSCCIISMTYTFPSGKISEGTSRLSYCDRHYKMYATYLYEYHVPICTAHKKKSDEYKEVHNHLISLVKTNVLKSTLLNSLKKELPKLIKN